MCCVACVVERPAIRPMTALTLDERMALTLDERREIYDWEMANGLLAECRNCGSVFRPADGEEATTRKGWCGSCEADWLERDILGPLVDRIGRRAARKALRRLVRGK